jgi:hypothetical protein
MITSRKKFKEYCLRKLGSPVIDINVAEEQVEDRITDALEMFWEIHADGSQKKYIAYELTADDITNKYLTIEDPEIVSVIRVLPMSHPISSINLEYQAFITDLLNPSRLLRNGTHGYVITEQYLSTLDQFFNREKQIRFNRFSGKIFVDTNWSILSAGDFMIIECYAKLSDDNYDTIWNDQWLKDYATALIKEQWGNNLSKYSGFTLPSGITVDGQRILQEAKEEIAKLLDELSNKWQLPPDFFTG